MDTDQKPYGRSTRDNLSNGLMYSQFDKWIDKYSGDGLVL